MLKSGGGSSFKTITWYTDITKKVQYGNNTPPFIQDINLRCLYFWNFSLFAPVYTSHADPPTWNTYGSHDWNCDFLLCNPLYQPTSISWKVCKLKCSTRRPYKWSFQNSSMFVETLGVAGFESWEMAATVTILGEPRTSVTEESSSPEVTIARAVPPPFLFWWVLTCFERWSLRINLLEHSGHSNLFSPVWVLLCLCNSSLLVNLLPQNIQLHTNGLSPVCQRRCARRWDVLP